MLEAKVVLVNEFDEEIGAMDKLEAHERGLLHRAFSVLVFNSKNELLLQRRAFGKYHSEGLWTNTCCSHPYPGESILDAGKRRLFEEMGFTCELNHAFSFIYKAELDKGLTEYELDHVMIGFSEETPHLNLEEVSAFRWMSNKEILADMEYYPENYTAWFRFLMTDYNAKIEKSILHESL